MLPDELKTRLRQGLICFPLTDFDDSGRFDRTSFSARLEWLLDYGPSVVATGAAGEFFSLDPAEYAAVTAATVETVAGRVPVLAATGYGTRAAISYALEAERAGADGLLLLPPYLTESPQEGLVDHISSVCAATTLGVVVYNRSNCVLNAASVARLAETAPNFIGFKDGHGDIEELMRVQSALGDRLAILNGMPTAEVYAQAYFGMSITSYSSAIFNFLPRSAMAFYNAVATGDRPAIERFTRDFLVPYGYIRRRRPGYAVSIVKAGVEIIGRSAGDVRPPLMGLSPEERSDLARLIEAAGPQD